MRTLLRVFQIIGGLLVLDVMFQTASGPVWAQGSNDAERAFSIEEKLQGSSSSFGQIFKLNTNLSYEFTKHFGVDAGVPFYFVRMSSTSTTTDASSNRGVGNVYTGLRMNFTGPVTYTSTITATAPTGDRDKGFSTGRVTVDWNNTFQKVIAERMTPYFSIGAANTVTDSPFFVRPFSSNGLVGHLEGGSTLSLTQLIYVGASGYAVLPSGDQRIVSRIVRGQQAPSSVPQNPRSTAGSQSTSQRAFETTKEVVGTADLASDQGFSSWFGIAPSHGLDFTLGFSRSQQYGLNTIFFGLGKRFGSFGPQLR